MKKIYESSFQELVSKIIVLEILDNNRKFRSNGWKIPVRDFAFSEVAGLKDLILLKNQLLRRNAGTLI